HELRTPLSLVLGPAERLAAEPAASPAVHRDAEIIARNARMLLHYVDDLLEVTRLEARSVEPEYVATDLARVARFVASHFEAAARTRGMSYVVEASAPVPGHADVGKLQRVLLNLLSNAFKFTPDGGRVRLTLRDGAGSERVFFEVADSGPGVPREKR